MSGPAGKTLEQVVQEAIYQARWIDAIRDAKMATDEEIAKTIVKALGATYRIVKRREAGLVQDV